MKKRDDIAESLADAIDPHMQKFAAKVTAMLRAHVEAKLELATKFAIDRLQADLAGDAVELKVLDQDDEQDEAPIAHRDVKPAKPTPRARDDRGALQANGKQPVTCRKCGYVGGNARGCGTAHETLNAGAKQNGVTVDTPPPTRSDRFSRIEAAARARASVER